VGVVNTPASMFGVLGIAIQAVRRTRSWVPLLVPFVAAALTRVEASFDHGGFFKTGYEADVDFKGLSPYSGMTGFSYPFILGLLAILVSFGKGLVFFTPGFFIPCPRDSSDRVRWVHGALVAFVVGLILAYAKWRWWFGGWFWGPRFFLAACIPASLVLALHASTTAETPTWLLAAVAVAIMLSFWVGISGPLFDQRTMGLCLQNRFEFEAYCNFVPELSALWQPLIHFPESLPPPERTRAVALIAWCLGVGAWVARSAIARLAVATVEGIRTTCAFGLSLFRVVPRGH
jgi:hypothetical protein